MKHNSFSLLIMLLLCSCSSKQVVEPAVTIPVEAVAVAPLAPIEDLKTLQASVFALEDQLYGTPKFGTLGLYGDLKTCKRKLSSRQYGGEGTLLWGEFLDRVSEWDGEEKANGSDELKTKRFRFYRMLLQARVKVFQQNIEVCNAELAKRIYNVNAPGEVLVEETTKGSLDSDMIRSQLCTLVQSGTMLSDFMINAFGNGWLLLADFQFDQNLLAKEVRDQVGKSRQNGFLFNGWRLSFADGPITLGDLLAQNKDSKLKDWAYIKKANEPSGDKCLATATGEWAN